MVIKWMGGALVILGCGGVGYLMAASYRRQEKDLRQLGRLLEYMASELSYRVTPLPELCHQVAHEAQGYLKRIFRELATGLEQNSQPEAGACMQLALEAEPLLPSVTRQALEMLGATLGRFDLEGQLNGLASVQAFCCSEREKMSAHREERIRNYQTLGLCAGVALAILLV